MNETIEDAYTLLQLGALQRPPEPARPDEVAAAALWLLSPAASLVLGVALPVDGGFTAH
jgi:NAD(P)-dependent dehydrogenase (short-subunit alcohol dehydrogenase family)